MIEAFFIGILSSMAERYLHDRYTAFAELPPIEKAIEETDFGFHPQVAGVKDALTTWCSSAEMGALWTAITSGDILSVKAFQQNTRQTIVRHFLDSSHFFAGDQTEMLAESILWFFFQSLQKQIYRSDDGLFFLARTTSFEFAELRRDIERIQHECASGLASIQLALSSHVPAPLPIQHNEQPEDEELARAIWREAIRNREALEPYLLTRIRREVVDTDYLPAIREALDGGKRRILTIIGHAGFGKTTVLGTLFDELATARPCWIGLIRCNDIIFSSTVTEGDFLLQLGKLLSGGNLPLNIIIERICRRYGTGIILIDTLDLILNQHTVPLIRRMLITLTEAGMTIVVTCRNYDFAGYFEPINERLPGVSSQIRRFEIPAFSTREVRIAASTFLVTQRSSSPVLEDSLKFADAILRLSADNRPLHEIVYNPLLLALLCSLFSQEGTVPPDLTVSKLYERYWLRRIMNSRLYPVASVEVRQKARLCYQLASFAFHASNEQMTEAVDEVDLIPSPEQSLTRACEELFSDGVLKHTATSRLRFFHQTFLEYVIARWILTSNASASLDDLLGKMASVENPEYRQHWWPILRQAFAIAEIAQVEYMRRKITLDDLAAFRTLAFAFSARDDLSPLLQLVEPALQRKGEFCEVIRVAVLSASSVQREQIWQISLKLLEGCDLSITLVRTIALLLSRWEDQLAEHLAEVFSILCQRCGTTNEEETAVIFGQFIEVCLPLLLSQPDTQILRILRDHYHLLGDRSRRDVIRLHLDSTVPVLDQRELTKLIIGYPVATQEETLKLVTCTLPLLVGDNTNCIWSSWQVALHSPLNSGWRGILTRVIGHLAANDPSLLRSLLMQILNQVSPDPSVEFTTLRRAILDGGAESLWELLRDTTITSATPTGEELRYILGLELLPHIPPHIRPAINTWYATSVSAHGKSHARSFRHGQGCVIDDIADALSQIAELPQSERLKNIRSVIRDAPLLMLHQGAEELEKQLACYPRSVELECARVELHARLIELSPEMLISLLDIAAITPYPPVTRIVLEKLTSLVEQGITVEYRQLVSFAASRLTMVRINTLILLEEMLGAERVLDEAIGLQLSGIFLLEEPQEIIRYFHFVRRWVALHGKVPDELLIILDDKFEHIQSMHLYRGAVARSFIGLLRECVQYTNEEQQKHLRKWILATLVTVDLQRVKNSERDTIALLCNLAYRDEAFLSVIVDSFEHFSARNRRAVAIVIRFVEGANSKLFDIIATNEQCDEGVRNLILNLKGL